MNLNIELLHSDQIIELISNLEIRKQLLITFKVTNFTALCFIGMPPIPNNG